MESQYIYKKQHQDCKIKLYQAHLIVYSFVKILMFVQCFLSLGFFASEKKNICVLSYHWYKRTEEIIAFLKDKC